MHKIGLLLQKEWIEFKQQRMLILGIVVLPLLLTLIPLISLFTLGAVPSVGKTDEFTREFMGSSGVAVGSTRCRSTPRTEPTIALQVKRQTLEL